MLSALRGYISEGRPEDAAAHAGEALDIQRKTGNPLGTRRAEEVLGQAGGG